MRAGKNDATKEYHAAQRAVTRAMKRVRQVNDELTDANSQLKDASARLARASRGRVTRQQAENEAIYHGDIDGDCSLA
ncbi:MAG TPA: hypothetical protein VGH13_11515 [Xanthobacteraceae bacterium]